MCDICVINSVKSRMLSRRNFLKGVAVSSVTAAAAATALAPAALADGHQSIEDLTHTISDEFPTYFGEPGISSEQLFKFKDNGFNLFRHTINEHTGTHIDAPLHFTEDGTAVDEIAVGNLVVPCLLYTSDAADE